MVCEFKIKQLEKELGRKLNEREKRKIREKMGHIEIEECCEEEIGVVA